MTQEENLTDGAPVEEGTKDEGIEPSHSGGGLDTITDPEELRKIAISRGNAYKRVAQELKEIKTTLTPQDPLKQPVTRADMRLDATQDAKKSLPAEITEKWDALLDYVPSRYKDAYKSEDIQKAMKAAHAAYILENPPAEKPDPAIELQGDAGMQGMGGKPDIDTSKNKKDDGWGNRSGPENWFKKPNQK